MAQGGLQFRFGREVQAIARAAEGSARDGLSILDQAIAHGEGRVSAEQVRDMLGQADRGRIRRLLSDVLAGDVTATLAQLDGPLTVPVATPAVKLTSTPSVAHQADQPVTRQEVPVTEEMKALAEQPDQKAVQPESLSSKRFPREARS